MVGFTDTSLWKRTLGDDSRFAGPLLEDLRSAYLQLRERAAVLAGMIPLDLRDFTVHDSTHSDALWETATVIAGDSYELTPLEAFVLGAAFQIHDLGMGLAAWSGGIDALKARPDWGDIVAIHFRQATGKSPTQADLDNPPPEVHLAAKQDALRTHHAEKASELALTTWHSEATDQQYHLIESADLRSNYGAMIGNIAASHWWSLRQLSHAFNIATIGAPPGSPDEWTVDPLKLACLLRLADIAHLDSRRAPGFAAAILDPGGESRDHWIFQRRLQKVRRRDDRLEFTAASSFPRSEASAWWLCFDSVQAVDTELREVDALLADTNRHRFAARSVAGADDPRRFSEFVRPDGWAPASAMITVSDVAVLVRRLGGAELYGDAPHVAVRELIQNASDAVRALRALGNLGPDEGEIAVRLGEDDTGHWLEVDDNGIGISASTLTGALLDFGKSYWTSSLVRTELPGLLATGFEPTGRYGIGFFSVFMIGDRVQVATRRYDAALTETLILEFGEGLTRRPLLRSASPDERRARPGTSVRVWLRNHPTDFQGLFRSLPVEDANLTALCRWLCPALEVDLVTFDSPDGERVIRGGDWRDLSPMELIDRTTEYRKAPTSEVRRARQELALNIRELRGFRGDLVGRVALAPQSKVIGGRYVHVADSAALVAGGIRVCEVSNMIGVIHGRPARAARDVAIPDVAEDELSRWATEQAILLPNAIGDPFQQLRSAEAVRVCGGETASLPVAFSRDGFLTASALSEWAAEMDDVILVDDYHADIVPTSDGFAVYHKGDVRGSWRAIDLLPNVLLVSSGPSQLLSGAGSSPRAEWPPVHVPVAAVPDDEDDAEAWWWWYGKGLGGLVVERLAKAWHSSTIEILEHSGASLEDDYADRQLVVAASGDGSEVMILGQLMIRPSRDEGVPSSAGPSNG